MSIEIPKYIKGETRKKLSEVACKVEVLLPETVQETFVIPSPIDHAAYSEGRR